MLATEAAAVTAAAVVADPQWTDIATATAIRAAAMATRAGPAHEADGGGHGGAASEAEGAPAETLAATPAMTHGATRRAIPAAGRGVDAGGAEALRCSGLCTQAPPLCCSRSRVA